MIASPYWTRRFDVARRRKSSDEDMDETAEAASIGYVSQLTERKPTRKEQADMKRKIKIGFVVFNDRIED